MNNLNMTKAYCVVGATRGTGLHIATQLLERGSSVRVVVRDAAKARRLLGDHAQMVCGNVTEPDSLKAALNADCHVIFYAVDVTGGIGGRSLFGPSRAIRDVTYQGLVNVVNVARANGFRGRIVLLSGMGCDRPSLTGMVLNAVKGNLQKNMVDREQYLKRSGLDHVICRGAVLTDEPPKQRSVRVTAPIHSLSARRTLARADFARVLIAAADLPAATRRVYDVFGERGHVNRDRDIDGQLEVAF